MRAIFLIVQVQHRVQSGRSAILVHGSAQSAKEPDGVEYKLEGVVINKYKLSPGGVWGYFGAAWCHLHLI